MIVDTEASMRFLRTAYEPDDWIALFLKSYKSGRTMQRVGPLSLFLQPNVHAWLRAMNARRFNVYVSVNAIRAGCRTRTRDAIGAIRHIFLEADRDAPRLIETISARAGLPAPSYVLESSPGRVHVFWRAIGFTPDAAERLQKDLAKDLGTDEAATPCSQTTRLPGYVNHKYTPGHLVTIEYREVERRHPPERFPMPPERSHQAQREPTLSPSSANPIERARRYLAKVEPAIAGQHGDLHTFKVCCRIVRGFAMSDTDALALLSDWNSWCDPPWTERELLDKISRARKYGREPVGGLQSAAGRLSTQQKPGGSS